MKKCSLFFPIFLILVGLAFAEVQESFEIKLSLDSGSFSLISVQKTFSALSDYAPFQNSGHRLEIYSADDGLLYSGPIAVPRSGITASDGSSNFNVYAPYFEDSARILIYDNTDALQLDIPVEISGSQMRNIHWFFWITPIFAAIVFLAYLEFFRLKHHSQLEKTKIDFRMLNLKNFILYNQKKGFTRDQIRGALIKSKHSEKEIDEAFRILK